MYLCIDLKTFYASVECAERNLDPYTTNLIVADPARGNGSVCLAVTPKMKMLGVKNRCRVFEIPKNIKYIIAKPRMSKYIEYSANIYEVYLEFFSKEDIYVYSIDEVFIDISKYLKMYGANETKLASMVIQKVYDKYQITATAGIGTNMYLAKIAMDIIAKHTPSNIAYLDEESFKEKLWNHVPLTDFWGIGKGIEKRLNKMCIFTMEHIAKTSEEKLYKEFGVNARFLIEHAWGKETTNIKDIKSYIPESRSISNSQILFEDYTYEDTILVIKEMVELMSERLIRENLITSNVSLYIGYSKNAIKATGGSMKLNTPTNIYDKLVKDILVIYSKTTSKEVKIRKIGISFNNLSHDDTIQLTIWDDQRSIEKKKNVEYIISSIKEEFGKNSIIKGMNLENKATTISRNKLIGGHNGW